MSKPPSLGEIKEAYPVGTEVEFTEEDADGKVSIRTGTVSGVPMDHPIMPVTVESTLCWVPACNVKGMLGE